MPARRKAIVVKRDELLDTGLTREFEGVRHGGVEVSLVLTEAGPGEGPALHAHPYDEVHVVQKGKAAFAGGGSRGVLSAGDIIVIPAGVPHRFENCGRGTLRDLGIHLSPRFSTRWLTAPGAERAR
jgi:mannose-6-phosphate isomerase-like protein (cupin superfamily)